MKSQKEKKIVKSKIAELTTALMYIHLETSYCCFFDLCGHVDWIEFSIRESKTNYFRILYPISEECRNETIYLPSGFVSVEDFVEQIDESLLELKEFLK